MFRVPLDWHIWDNDQLRDVALVPFAPVCQSPQTGEDCVPIISQAAFDGAPTRDALNLVGGSEGLAAAAEAGAVPFASLRYPVGSFVIREVSFEEREILSRDFLMSSIVRGNLESDDRRARIQDPADFGNGYEGIRRTLFLSDPATASTGVVYLVSVTNPNDTRIYSIAAGCSESCWDEHEAAIREVIDSWLVNTET